jgi:hypothetical protein
LSSLRKEGIVLGNNEIIAKCKGKTWRLSNLPNGCEIKVLAKNPNCPMFYLLLSKKTKSILYRGENGALNIATIELMNLLNDRLQIGFSQNGVIGTFNIFNLHGQISVDYGNNPIELEVLKC